MTPRVKIAFFSLARNFKVPKMTMGRSLHCQLGFPTARSKFETSGSGKGWCNSHISNPDQAFLAVEPPKALPLGTLGLPTAPNCSLIILAWLGTSRASITASGCLLRRSSRLALKQARQFWMGMWSKRPACTSDTCYRWWWWIIAIILDKYHPLWLVLMT